VSYSISAIFSRLRPIALVLGLLLGALCQHAALAADADSEVRQTWKLLDYIAVDYTEAVADGVVINDGEYAEMKEFSETALTSLSALPPREGQQALVTQAGQLQAAIAAMAAPSEVASLAHALADALLAAYPVPVAPSQAPDLVRGAAIYSEHCASCHGVQGRGDGEAAVNMDPPPIAFTDQERARERSLFSLFEVVSQGLADTAMVSYQDVLSEDDRWSVAFYASTLSGTPEVRAQGETLWQGDAALRARLPNLEALARTIESVFATEVGADQARAVLAYLRTNPQALGQNTADGLALARTQLAASLKAYQSGDAKTASTLALSSYLDGFEPVEAMLRTRDADLLVRVENAMIEYRARINRQAPAADVAAQAQVLSGLFDATGTTLSAEQDDMATFLGAFTILLREGVEALLVVVAMITFLTKVERRDVLPYVHAGWVGALAAGLLTWFVAATMIDISGANRELTEGFSSLFAAAVLLAVGIWMHQKSLAGRWQIYLKEKLSAALTKQSAFFLFALAFVAVYREVFETILFYIALWTRGNGTSILAGFAAGVAVLAVITVVMLRTSRRLPISQFFGWSSLLIAILAVVLAGKGFAALQEAGVVPAIAVNAPRFEAFGVYPSLIPLLAQGAVLVVAVAGYLWNTRTVPKAAEG
jgi:high-affinity iron transporter